MPEDQPIQTHSESGIGAGASATLGQPIQKCQIELKGLTLKINLKLKNQQEKIVKEVETPANSFVLNFMKMLYAVLQAKSYEGFRCARIRQEVQYKIEYRYTFYIRELAGIQAWSPKEDATHGIIIGTGTKEVTAYDTWLEAQISNGMETGQMIYLFSEVTETETVGNEAHIYLKRSFINHSGASITVKEIGVAVWNVSPSSNKLIIRDLIPPLEVPNDYTLDTQYTIEVAL
jgi:hypothetical protein